MYPPIFQVCAANEGVTAMLGTAPVRLYPFGLAPQGTVLPYAVWQIISGSPFNSLNSRPDTDYFGIQVDVYADSVTPARDAAKAIRDAVEKVAYVVAWNGEERDDETQNYRISFDIDWHVPRS